MDVTFWIIAAIVFLVVEFSTVALVSEWFAAGAIAALIAALLGAPFWLQLVLFALVSVVLLVLLRPFLRKYVQPKKTRTNVDALRGKQALVTEPIDNLQGTGSIKLNGAVWTARSADGSRIDKDTVVVVQGVEGVKALVLPEPVPAVK